MRGPEWHESAVASALLTLLVACASCGAPSAPSSLPQPVSPPAFQPGSYDLGIGARPTSDGVSQISACTTPIRVPVDVQSFVGGFRVRALHGTLDGNIVVQGVRADVVLRGYAAEVGGASGISVQGNEATLTGTVTADRSVAGLVTIGGIDLLLPGGILVSCTPLDWSLSARSHYHRP